MEANSPEFGGPDVALACDDSVVLRWKKHPWKLLGKILANGKPNPCTFQGYLGDNSNV